MTAALFALETWVENNQVQGSPGCSDALRGLINCGQQADTVNGAVSVGSHVDDTPGMVAVTATLLLPAANWTASWLPLATSVHSVLVSAFGWLVLRWYCFPPRPLSVHSYEDGVTGAQPVGQFSTAAKLATAEPGAHPVTSGWVWPLTTCGRLILTCGQHDGQESMVTVTDAGGAGGGGQFAGRMSCKLAVRVTGPEVFAAYSTITLGSGLLLTADTGENAGTPLGKVHRRAAPVVGTPLIDA